MATQAERIAALETHISHLSELLCEVRDGIREMQTKQALTDNAIIMIQTDVSRLPLERMIGGTLMAVMGAVAGAVGIPPETLHDLFK